MSLRSALRPSTVIGALFAILTLFNGCTPSSEWKVISNRDKITDQEYDVLVGKTLDELVAPATVLRPEAEKVRPWFRVKVTRGEGYAIEYNPWPPQVDYGQGVALIVRLDDDKPMTFPAYERRDARGLFLIRTGGDLLWRMRTAKMMLVQYQSIDGKQVLRYSLDGFRPKLDELCSKYPKECGPFPDVAAN